MIRFLEEQQSNHRRLQLFACACCRRVWDLLRLDGARRVVELAEACADGEASAAELEAAHDHPDFARLEAQLRGEGDTGLRLTVRVVGALRAARELASLPADIMYILQDTSKSPERDFAADPNWHLCGEARDLPTDEAELAKKARILRDSFGNPFHPVPFNPEWRTETVGLLARQMYESRDFGAMLILTDALQDAGCDNPDNPLPPRGGNLLDHCRGSGPHVRGCWVVDSVLGQEQPQGRTPRAPGPL
jgi:hypothetical protein